VPKPEKVTKVERLRSMLAQTPNYYFVEFSGLSVSQMNALRRDIINAGGRIEVVKNTLLRRALSELGADNKLEAYLVGPTAVLYCPDDPIGPARVLREFAKEHPSVRLKAGYIEGEVLDSDAADAVAQLPGKTEIQAGLVAALVGPATQLLCILNAAVAEFVYVLEAVVDKRREAETA
jgi:large subunit ribosomal protein L10